MIRDTTKSFIENLRNEDWTYEQIEFESKKIEGHERLLIGQINELSGAELHNRFLIYQEVENSPVKRSTIWKLAQGSWDILECREAGFITTDNPGIAMQGNQSFNLLNEGKFSYYFPLSSIQLVRITCDNHVHTLPFLNKVKYLNIGIGETEEINCFLCLNAVKDIYGPRKEVLARTRELLSMNK